MFVFDWPSSQDGWNNAQMYRFHVGQLFFKVGKAVVLKGLIPGSLRWVTWLPNMVTFGNTATS